jgi:type I restriction enzyme, R subunit
VRVTIQKMLDTGLPKIYTPALFEQKTTAVFEHVNDANYGAGRSEYAIA